MTRRSLSSSTTPWAGFSLEVHESPAEGDVQGLNVVASERGYSLVVIDHGTPDVEYKSGAMCSRVRLWPGHLSLTGPEMMLDHIKWQGRAEYTVVSMPPEIMVGLSERAPVVKQAQLPALLHAGRDPQVEGLLACMRRDIEAGCPSGALFGQSISLALATHLGNRYGDGRRPKVTPRNCGLSISQYRRIDEYLRAHLSEDIGVFTLAALAGLSPSYFAGCFTQSFGMPPHRYLTKVRVDEAQRLLRNSELSLAEIALRVGYSDQSHFTHAFRRVTGATPASWSRRSG